MFPTSRRGRLTLAVVAAAILVLAGLVVVWLRLRTRLPEHVASDKKATITTADGTRLAAEVITPKGRGKAPLVVMPGSWGSPSTEYHYLGLKFANAGYVVVGYAQRGFSDSTGGVDLAGAPTQRDVSTVIDWALAHTGADPHHIGVLGISYGGGMALLAAERDPRIRAVVAMSTWTDMAASFTDNHTVSTAILRALFTGAQRNGHPGPYVAGLIRDLPTDPEATGAAIDAKAAVRSPITHVTALNRSGAAVMIANGYQDSVFPPQQLVRFFAALTTPKRLQLAVGDHGGPEYAGLVGRSDETVDDALAWLDHYLRGHGDAIASEKPIQLKDAVTGAWHGYDEWPKATTRLDLGKPNTPSNAGSSPATWSAPLRAGTDSAATSGAIQISSAAAYRPAVTSLAATAASGRALVWAGPAASTSLLVSGTATLTITLDAAAPSATFFAYLYDMSPAGVGRLMSVTPYTATGLTAGRPTTITLSLNPTSFTLRAGDHVALAIDTVDPRYHAVNRPGSTLTFSSSAADPALITLPTS